MKLFKPLLTLLLLAILGIYLFVTAPMPLPETTTPAGERLPVRVLFDALAAEQAAARGIFNAEIVTPGLRAGLRFSEEWKNPGVEAGPLPALLLREVSARLQSHGSGVGLFLGSDFPIAAPNRFNGPQTQRFNEMKANGRPAYFVDTGTGMQTAMYIDPAGAPGCVTCHNEHPESSKQNWVLNDPMGATTWLFREETVSAQDVLVRLAALRQSVRESYQSYLDKAAYFINPAVTIGSKWPSEGLFLPDADTFMTAISRRASERTLLGLIAAAGAPHAVSSR
jgi:hypothetical protein